MAWRWYIQLTQAAFRTAKSDLKLRPIYHQKNERVEAHIPVKRGESSAELTVRTRRPTRAPRGRTAHAQSHPG